MIFLLMILVTTLNNTSMSHPTMPRPESHYNEKYDYGLYNVPSCRTMSQPQGCNCGTRVTYKKGAYPIYLNYNKENLTIACILDERHPHYNHAIASLTHGINLTLNDNTLTQEEKKVLEYYQSLTTIEDALLVFPVGNRQLKLFSGNFLIGDGTYRETFYSKAYLENHFQNKSAKKIKKFIENDKKNIMQLGFLTSSIINRSTNCREDRLLAIIVLFKTYLNREFNLNQDLNYVPNEYIHYDINNVPFVIGTAQLDIDRMQNIELNAPPSHSSNKPITFLHQIHEKPYYSEYNDNPDDFDSTIIQFQSKPNQDGEAPIVVRTLAKFFDPEYTAHFSNNETIQTANNADNKTLYAEKPNGEVIAIPLDDHLEICPANIMENDKKRKIAFVSDDGTIKQIVHLTYDI